MARSEAGAGFPVAVFGYDGVVALRDCEAQDERIGSAVEIDGFGVIGGDAAPQQ